MTATYQYSVSEAAIIAQLGAANGDAAALAEAEFRAGRLSMAAVMRFAADKAKPADKALSVYIGQSGTVCVYGLGQRPVSLYASQWERALTPDMVGKILAVCRSDAKGHFDSAGKRVEAGTPGATIVSIARK